MKTDEFQKSRRTYRRSVDAYAQLQQTLRSVRRAVETVPHLRKALDRFTLAAERDLQKIGEAVALVIETTDELEEQKVRCESFRRQAEAAGICLRYDRPAANEDAVSDTTPHSEDDDSEI